MFKVAYGAQLNQRVEPVGILIGNAEPYKEVSFKLFSHSPFRVESLKKKIYIYMYMLEVYHKA